MRDRLRALAEGLARSRADAWLVGAGTIVLRDAGGESRAVRGGALLRTGDEGRRSPRLPVPPRAGGRAGGSAILARRQSRPSRARPTGRRRSPSSAARPSTASSPGCADDPDRADSPSAVRRRPTRRWPRASPGTEGRLHWLHGAGGHPRGRADAHRAVPRLVRRDSPLSSSARWPRARRSAAPASTAEDVDQTILGHARQAGNGPNTGRQVVDPCRRPEGGLAPTT